MEHPLLPRLLWRCCSGSILLRALLSCTYGFLDALAHRRTSFGPSFAAAASAARKMLGYVPQRQRCPLTAVFTSSSVQFGLCSMSAAQLITIPGVQKPHC